MSLSTAPDPYGVAPSCTSVPNRNPRPELESARSIILVSDRDRELDPPLPAVPTVRVAWDGVASCPQLEDRLADAHVGVRIVAVGDETLCYGVLSRARAAGALDDEVSLIITDRGPVRVFCTHCRHTGIQDDAEVGAVITCAGCARRLVIYHHFSRRTASYMGYMVDAEEAA